MVNNVIGVEIFHHFRDVARIPVVHYMIELLRMPTMMDSPRTDPVHAQRSECPFLVSPHRIHSCTCRFWGKVWLVAIPLANNRFMGFGVHAIIASANLAELGQVLGLII